MLWRHRLTTDRRYHPKHQQGESSVVKKILLLLVVVAVGLLIAKQIAGREH